LSLHVENFRVDLVASAISLGGTCPRHGFLKLTFQFHLLLLIELDLCSQIFSILCVPLRDLAVCYLQLSLDVRILVVLGQTALLKWPRRLLFRQAALYHIELANAVLNRIIFVFKIVALTAQIPLHVCNVVVAGVFFVTAPSLLDHSFDSAQLRRQHLYLLLQEVLFFFQRVVFALKFDHLVFLVGCGHWHTLPGTVVHRRLGCSRRI